MRALRARPVHHHVTGVLLVALPELLRTIFACAAAPSVDVRVVGVLDSIHDLDDVEDMLDDVDVIIAALPGSTLPLPACRALNAHTNIALLTVDPESGEARLWRLRPHATVLCDRSAEELLRVARDDFRQPRWDA